MLATGIFCAWLALSGFEPVVAAATDELRLAVTTGGYRLQLPLGPMAVGSAGLILAWVRYRFFTGGRHLQDRLSRATLLAVVLLALRLASLLDPIAHVFPYLTLLWSPHALWAVALVFPGFVHMPPANGRKALPTTYVAGGLLAIFLPLYFLYTLYFCQITMLHGDEGHYLRVSQSLLHDGDMDLANNLGDEQTREFHVRDFAVHKAPASPGAKVHSVHPIGLSVALVPAYWWGLEKWQNPRLAAALFMVLLASLCIPLVFLYLTRLGTEPWAALLATGITAVTGPFFFYTNQLFPEVPALLISLVAILALAHWQVPGGSYRSLGRWEVPLLGLLTLLLCCLPFLHPRLAPLGLLCGAGVLLQAWHSPRRSLALSGVGLVAAAGLYALVSFNFAFSGDWMGPFRPGNAWEEGALDVATWSSSLPGQWLHVGKGLLNNSPIFFFSLFGLAALARMRDRRVVVGASLYVATAAVNGLHPGWGFGFCLPARFLVTALPMVVLGLAWGLTKARHSATAFYFAGFALAVSIESLFNTLLLPEDGYDGQNLINRSINHFYPLHQHFPQGQGEVPLLDMAFWGLLSGAMLFRPGPGVRWAGPIRLGLISMAAFAPFVWTRSDAVSDRLPWSLSPYMAPLSSTETTAGTGPGEFNIPITLDPVAEAAQPNGGLYARPGATSAGMVSFSRIPMPIGAPLGIYQLTFPGLRVEPPGGQVSGHIVVTLGYTLPVTSLWGTRTSYPLIGGIANGEQSLIIKDDQPGINRVYSMYSGHGEFALDAIRATFLPFKTEPRTEELHRFPHEMRERPLQTAVRFSELPAGHYRARFNLTAPATSAFASFFERNPVPFRVAVHSGPARPGWFRINPAKGKLGTLESPDYQRPMQEGVHPPWWLSIPFAGDRARELQFVLAREQDVFFLLHYDGPAGLGLTDIVLYREFFD